MLFDIIDVNNDKVRGCLQYPLNFVKKHPECALRAIMHQSMGIGNERDILRDFFLSEKGKEFMNQSPQLWLLDLLEQYDFYVCEGIIKYFIETHVDVLTWSIVISKGYVNEQIIRAAIESVTIHRDISDACDMTETLLVSHYDQYPFAIIDMAKAILACAEDNEKQRLRERILSLRLPDKIKEEVRNVI